MVPPHSDNAFGAPESMESSGFTPINSSEKPRSISPADSQHQTLPENDPNQRQNGASHAGRRSDNAVGAQSESITGKGPDNAFEAQSESMESSGFAPIGSSESPHLNSPADSHLQPLTENDPNNRRNGASVTKDLRISDQTETRAAAITITKGVCRRFPKIIDESLIERRISPRLQNRPDKPKPVYGSPRKVDSSNPDSKRSKKKAKLHHDSKIHQEVKIHQERTPKEVSGDLNGDHVDPSLTDNGDLDSIDGMSSTAKVKDTLRIFSSHFLHYVQEEEQRCKKPEADEKEVQVTSKAKGKTSKPDVKSKNKSAVKSKLKKGEGAGGEDMKRSSKRPDLKAISRMIETGTILYPEKRFGHLPGIEVGHQFFSRAEMVVLGLHNHWLNGIDFIGQGHGKLEKYKGFTFPLAVSIVLSGQYEDDLDNSEDVVYTGQGGNDLLGNKRQIRDQVMKRGNLALKNNMECCVPVRVVRGHHSVNSYTGKVYTYDGLYKVVSYWAEKGVSGFTVFKYRLRRLEGQPALTTNQVYFSRAHAPKSLSELRGLVCEDISGGEENIPVPATNLVDDPPVPPTGFEYCSSIKVAKSVMIPTNAAGCGCKGVCVDPRVCACAKLNGSDFPYVRRDGGRLVEAKAVVFECGPNCGCGPACVNRTSQRGLKYRLEVFRTPNKGWAVRSWDSIPSGAPICEYIGILMRTEDIEDIDAVSENSFIFEIDCLQTMKGIDGRERRLGDVSMHTTAHLDKVDDKKLEITPEFCIDAGSTGSVARFINHSCQPNLFVQCVLSSHHDIKLARVMLFASDNIPPLQELTYDYGYPLDSVVGSDGKIKQMPCYCGAPDCRKRLY